MYLKLIHSVLRNPADHKLKQKHNELGEIKQTYERNNIIVLRRSYFNTVNTDQWDPINGIRQTWPVKLFQQRSYLYVHIHFHICFF